MLEEVYLYVLLYNLYKEYGICCYGMYGMFYLFIVCEVVECLGKFVNELNIINCYLGNGVFVCVIKNG